LSGVSGTVVLEEGGTVALLSVFDFVTTMNGHNVHTFVDVAFWWMLLFIELS
jgi:hypothetical protein